MIELIKSFLGGLKLTLGQWLGVTAAAVIGFLVFLLRLQGGKLHRAQVELLDAQWGHKLDTCETNTGAAEAAYSKAAEAFKKAGGKLLLLAALLLAPPPAGAQSEEPMELLLKCQDTLSLCDHVITSQKKEIDVLKKANVSFKEAAYKGPPSSDSSLLGLVPWPMWTVLGGVAGFAIGRSLR